MALETAAAVRRRPSERARLGSGRRSTRSGAASIGVRQVSGRAMKALNWRGSAASVARACCMKSSLSKRSRAGAAWLGWR